MFFPHVQIFIFLYNYLHSDAEWNGLKAMRQFVISLKTNLNSLSLLMSSSSRCGKLSQDQNNISYFQAKQQCPIKNRLGRCIAAKNNQGPGPEAVMPIQNRPQMRGAGTTRLGKNSQTFSLSSKPFPP